MEVLDGQLTQLPSPHDFEQVSMDRGNSESCLSLFDELKAALEENNDGINIKLNLDDVGQRFVQQERENENKENEYAQLSDSPIDLVSSFPPPAYSPRFTAEESFEFNSYLHEAIIPNFYKPRCGQDVQRLSVVTSLPHLLRDDRDECLRRVIPKIKEFLPIAQQDMQLAASSIFLQIFQQGIIPTSSFSQHLLPIMLNSLDNRDTDVGEAWLDTLLEVLPSLTKEVLRKEVLAKAVQKGQISQSIQSRLMSSRILGKVSICLESFVIKKEILPLVQSLCQDVEYEVRACMCRQLDLVAKGMGLESTKSSILPELVELANDEECSVRLAGLDTVVSVLALLDDETCVSTIIPLVVKFCQASIQDEDSTLPVVSRHLGKLCHGLAHNMTSAQRMWFLDFFKKLCLVGLDVMPLTKSDINDNLSNKSVGMNMLDDERPVECRINAAFNFPAMTLFAGGLCKFDSELYPTFSKLCRDPNVSVRKTMAHGFHEVARTVGSHVSLLLRDLIILFKDDYVDVLSGVVQNIEQTVSILTKSLSSDRQHGVGAEILPAILSCEHVISSSNDWRLKKQFLQRIACLTELCSSDQIYQRLIPLLFNKLSTAKALPVRLSAVKTLLVFMRCNRKLEQRQEICNRIISDFAKGKSFRNRTLFIDVCMSVLELYSHAFFKEHFYETALDLSSDPVANIRLRLCTLLPSLKKTIRLPADRNLLQQLESHVRKLLINERDRDVLSQLKTTVDELDKINCIHVHDSMHGRRNITPEDQQDQLKEEEERHLIEQEERERKEEEAEMAASGGKRKEKKNGSSSNPKVTSSKGNVEKKVTTKGSKIPTTPAATATKGPDSRKNSLSKMASNNGSLKPPNQIPSRLVAKSTNSSRNIGSASSTNSGGSLSSAGSNRSGRSSTSSTMGAGSPISSAGGRRRPELENHKRDSITSVNRRPSRDTVGMINRKQSH